MLANFPPRFILKNSSGIALTDSPDLRSVSRKEPPTMKTMNHTDYPRKLRTYSIEQLRFVIKDAQEAIAANPDNPNAGYYADEVCYAAQELRRRNAR